MVLSDRDLRQALCEGNLVVDPLDDNRIQPASIDLCLSREFLRNRCATSTPIDLGDVKGTYKFETLGQTVASDSITLQPGEFILGSTIERVEIPDFLVARVEGKSSLGRLGLIVHATAGYIDPGFKGRITLEIYNLNNRPIILRAGRSICQLSVIQMLSPAVYPYGHEKNRNRYQNSTTTIASRYDG